MNEVRLHVQDIGDFFADASDMARGLDRGRHASNNAQLGFESMEVLLKVLTPGRWRLLRALRRSGASSVRALARVLERDYRGVHADVVALREVGLVETDAEGKVRVPWSRITAEMSVDVAA